MAEAEAMMAWTAHTYTYEHFREALSLSTSRHHACTAESSMLYLGGREGDLMFMVNRHGTSEGIQAHAPRVQGS